MRAGGPSVALSPARRSKSRWRIRRRAVRSPGTTAASGARPSPTISDRARPSSSRNRRDPAVLCSRRSFDELLDGRGPRRGRRRLRSALVGRAGRPRAALDDRLARRRIQQPTNAAASVTSGRSTASWASRMQVSSVDRVPTCRRSPSFAFASQRRSSEGRSSARPDVIRQGEEEVIRGPDVPAAGWPAPAAEVPDHGAPPPVLCDGLGLTGRGHERCYLLTRVRCESNIGPRAVNPRGGVGPGASSPDRPTIRANPSPPESVAHARSRRRVHRRAPGQRPAPDHRRGPPRARRRRERLVQRRLEARGPGQDRLRAPVRARDVPGLARTSARPSTWRSCRPPAGRSTARPGSTARTTSRRCRRTSSSSPCGSRRTGWARCSRR